MAARGDGLPIPLPVIAGGAALAVITSAVLLSFTLGGSDGDNPAPGGNARAELSTSTLGGQQTGPWLSQVTTLPAASLMVSAQPGDTGFSVVLQRGDRGGESPAGMQVALLDGAGLMVREISPVLPQSWLLTHAVPVGKGEVAVLGQTADGVFLFRIDRDGQPVWGRFESAGEAGKAAGTSLLKSGEMLIIAAPGPRGLDLDLVAYDLDGRRLWSQSVPGLLAGSYALSGTPAGELVLAGTLAVPGGDASPRFIRLDRTGTVQIDAPLTLPGRNTVQRAAVASDDSVYILSTGEQAVLQRVSPRGTGQWQAVLAGWPGAGDTTSDLVALANGAAVTRVEAGALHAARVSGSGLDVSTSLVRMPEGLDSLGTRIDRDGQVMAVLMADPAPARPRLIHAQADLRDLFRGSAGGTSDGPIRTVALDDVAREPVRVEPLPDIRGGLDPEPPVRQPVPERRVPEPIPASAGDTSPPPAPTARFADCTFICMPEGVPAAKYPVSRSYEISRARTLNDITLDAFSLHEGLCLESGGLAHVGSVPICTEN